MACTFWIRDGLTRAVIERFVCITTDVRSLWETEMNHREVDTKVDTTLYVYAQVVDGSLRRAAETVAAELFTIVHKPENASELSH